MPQEADGMDLSAGGAEGEKSSVKASMRTSAQTAKRDSCRSTNFSAVDPATTPRTTFTKAMFMDRCMPKRRKIPRQRRLIDRLGPMKTSTHHFHLEQYADRESWAQILDLYTIDWFHVLLTMPWRYIVFIVGVVQFLHILTFSGFYHWLNSRGPLGCGMNSEPGADLPFFATFGFSLITMGTVGYGTLDNTSSFYSGCGWIPLLVFFQTLTYLSLDGFLINLVYLRLERADQRSRRVLFSKKAVIRHIAGKFYFSFQIYDLEKKIPLVEAHCRCYAVKSKTKRRDKNNFKSEYMRLQNPDDELNSTMFMGLPVQTMHRIDYLSPLMPKEISKAFWKNSNDDYVHSLRNRKKKPCLVNRDEDSRVGVRDSCVCPICGTPALDDKQLLNHARHFTEMEALRKLKSLRRNLKRAASVVHLESNEENSLLDELDYVKIEPRRVQSTWNVATSRDKSGKKRLKEYGDKNVPYTHADLETHLLRTRHDIVSEKERKKIFTENNSTEEATVKIRDTKTPEAMLKAIQDNLISTNMEIIVLVEGIEPSCSGTFQARCSYKFEDIEFGKWFAPCVYKRRQGRTVVDLNKFNETVEADYFTYTTPKFQNVL